MQRVCTPPPLPPHPRDDLWLPNAVIQNLLHRLMCILNSSHYFITWSKVWPFLTGALPRKKNPGPAPGISFYPDSTLWWRGGGRINLKKMWFRCADSLVSCRRKSAVCVKLKRKIAISKISKFLWYWPHL